ncbi:MAG: hypothetical protein U9P10_09310 [Thermodesulfobacteriota bacterium]|nr:hypothetical protein [Thermodesulfobacteriota bacterium]
MDIKTYLCDDILTKVDRASRQYLEAPMLEKFWQEHQSGLRSRSTELWFSTKSKNRRKLSVQVSVINPKPDTGLLSAE